MTGTGISRALQGREFQSWAFCVTFIVDFAVINIWRIRLINFLSCPTLLVVFGDDLFIPTVFDRMGFPSNIHAQCMRSSYQVICVRCFALSAVCAALAAVAVVVAAAAALASAILPCALATKLKCDTAHPGGALASY